MIDGVPALLTRLLYQQHFVKGEGVHNLASRADARNHSTRYACCACSSAQGPAGDGATDIYT